MISVDRLRDYPLFAGLSETELSKIAPCLSKRTFAKGAYLFFSGSPILNIYLVESGLIRMFFTNTVGQEFLLNLAGPGATIGFPILREGQTRLLGGAALLPSTLLVLSMEDTNYFMKRYPRFLHNVYGYVDTSIRKLLLYARGLATISLQGRIATLLLSLTEDDKGQGVKNEVELPLTQSDIAAWVGASRGALNRALTRLEQLGLIHVEAQKFIILDRPGLQRMTEDLILDQE